MVSLEGIKFDRNLSYLIYRQLQCETGNLLILCCYFFLSLKCEKLLEMSLQISFGPISWLMVSEIFPLRTRGKGISLAVLTNFGSNAIVTFAFSPLKVLIPLNFCLDSCSFIEVLAYYSLPFFPLFLESSQH